MVKYEIIKDLKNLICEVENFTAQEAYRRELKISSSYYYIELNCIHIINMELLDDILRITLPNNRRFECRLTDEFKVERVNW